jgi:protein-disulfide isomerase
MRVRCCLSPSLKNNVLIDQGIDMKIGFVLVMTWGLLSGVGDGLAMAHMTDSFPKATGASAPFQATNDRNLSAAGSTGLGHSHAPAQIGSPPIPPADLKAAVRMVLEEHPELILEVLQEHEITLADLVERGTRKKQIAAKRQRILDELKNPLAPALDGNRPIRGRSDAPITIVEYSDFECPYCAAAHRTIQQVLRRFNGQVRLIYKHNPLEFHPTAEPAARYFEAIALQDHGQAWSFHDRVFEQQEQLEAGEPALQAIVASLNIDPQRLEKDLSSATVTRHIEEDRDEAQRFGFDGTPAFLINGISLLGNHPETDFIDIIRMVYAENRSAEGSSELSGE